MTAAADLSQWPVIWPPLPGHSSGNSIGPAGCGPAADATGSATAVAGEAAAAAAAGTTAGAVVRATRARAVLRPAVDAMA
jgi:hypothetical protein